MKLKVVIDSHLKFDPVQLKPDLLCEILAGVTVKNPKKDRAVREMLYSAEDMPDYLELWHWNSLGEIVLPRGYIDEFEDILEGNNINIQFDNKTIDTTYNSVDRFNNVPRIELRDYQLKACNELEYKYNGILSSPTGSGKTRVMLELIRRCMQKTIVIVEKNDLIDQWFNMAADLGFTHIGKINSKNFDDYKDLVFATRQSLIKEIDEHPEWYNNFGMIVVDEMHHSSSNTMFDLIQRFPAKYRFGCSATPDTDKDYWPICKAVIGPIVSEISPKEVGDHLVIPRVKVVETEFEFDYRPTERVGKKIFRNNYNNCMKALEDDKDRNILIISKAIEEALQGRHCIILSKRKKHLKNIAENIQKSLYKYSIEYEKKGILPAEICLNSLTGENSSESDIIKERIENYKCGSILFSTLAEEGTDIPKLDRLFLAYPGRKTRGFEQAIGRIMRPHPEKEDAIVYDFRDVNVSLLNSQFRERCHMIYNKKKYNVEFV